MNEVTKKRQSLPRHTVLAPMSRRIGATIVDAAIAFLMALILFFGGTNLIFSPSIMEKESYLYTQEYHSHLFKFENEKRIAYNENVSYETYIDVLSYYYLNYLTGENVVPSEDYTGDIEFFKAPNYKEFVPGTQTLPKDYYTVSWFNKNVLEIEDDIPTEKTSAYFAYVIDEFGNPDKTKIGVKRDKHYSTTTGTEVVVSDNEVSNFLSRKYSEAYLESLAKMDFYHNVYLEIGKLTSISWIIPLYLGVIINYVIIPLFTSNSATFGKKIFKLGLCGIDGYSMEKWRLILRAVPVLITLVGMFFIPMTSYYFSLVVGAVVLMASVALFAASPKHCALHDYAARTLCIDADSSIIFENQIEEEEFVQSEDLQ